MSGPRRLRLFQGDELIGTLPVVDSWRLPLSDAEIASIPTAFIAGSRSWLLVLREGDLKLQRRGEGPTEELVIQAVPQLCPGDFGLLVGFEAAAGKERYAADEEVVALADSFVEAGRPVSMGELVEQLLGGRLR